MARVLLALGFALGVGLIMSAVPAGSAVHRHIMLRRLMADVETAGNR